MCFFVLRLSLILVLLIYPRLGFSTENVVCPDQPENEDLISNSKIVIFGEVHGTSEVPMYIGGLLCRLTQQGKQIILGLELPITEQNQLANYLSSAGKNSDRDTLTQSEFWQRPSDRQDGRSSVAILNLIEQVRSMREHGAKISILAIDADPKDGILDRDEFMASTARRAIHSIEDPTFIALVGNIHGKKNLGTFFDRNYESFGYKLRELGPTTVNIKFISGTAWICNGKKCDIQPIFNTRKIDTSKIGFQLNRDNSSEYDLTLILANSHASPPANSIP